MTTNIPETIIERLDFDDLRLDNLAADSRLILNQRLPEIKEDIAELKTDVGKLRDENREGINRLGFMLIGMAGLILWQIIFR